ncbi:MAG: hypothetical protein FJZ78_04235 [Bacteroidetes bacterium]|nr:hypothetical protein [Bacteroidota bacterium]
MQFPDSVAKMLTAAGQSDATLISGKFSSVWKQLPINQQQSIRRHLRLMKELRFKPKQEVVQYIRTVAFSGHPFLTNSFSGWLAVTDSVFRYENPPRIGKFLESSRNLFEFQSLQTEKTFRYRISASKIEFEFFTQPFDPSKDSTKIFPDSLIRKPNLYAFQLSAAVTGAVAKFVNPELMLKGLSDSLRFSFNDGVFSLSDKVLLGQQGEIVWNKFDVEPPVYTMKGPWSLSVSKPEIIFDKGHLKHPKTLPDSVWGVFSFRISGKSDQKNPKFISFWNDIQTKRIDYPGLNFRGGYSLSGNQISSESVSGLPSKLALVRDSIPKFVVRSMRYDFRDSLVVAPSAAITIYHGQDSITHPSIDFVFYTRQHRVQLSRSRSIQKDVPYQSSYFGVDFSADELRWDIPADSINLYSASNVAQVPVVIESKDHFNRNDYRLLAGVGFSFHPLALVADYAKEIGTRTFYSGDLGTRYKKLPGEIRLALEFLVQKGMVQYDPSTGVVEVSEKAIHVTNAARNKEDYDNMKILAIPDKNVPNASLSLKNGEMIIRGVENFKVSDSLNLSIKPDSSMVSLRKNRDLQFDGRITAGNFEINGKDFQFKYDSFFITLKEIDSIRFLVTERNARGQKVRRRLSNAMVNADSTGMASAKAEETTSGVIYINTPDNKSGAKIFPDYPRLNASSGGIIFFDQPQILDGIYGRSVYFLIPPFKMDSLNQQERASIGLSGALVSSGMFPVFKEKLRGMEDKSLGFIHQVPPKGYNLYNTDGKFNGTLTLDNQGIIGNGELNFLAAKVKSDRFTFYPDSVVALSQSGGIEEKRIGDKYFPQITFPEFRLKWTPKADHFGIFSLKDPFALYDSTATLKGELSVSGTGVSGNGTMLTRGSELVSEKMTFEGKNFTARESTFKVLTNDPDKPALLAEAVKLNFDLNQNFAEINPELSGTAAIEFPYAQFKTSIPSARWELDRKKIVMKKSPTVPLEDSWFYSTKKDLDSLAFSATGAEYDIPSQQLLVTGIPYITVGDARITPDQGQLLLKPNSEIGQLTNATIVLDTLNGYHRLTGGVIDIASRKSFRGFGVYEYVNALQDTFRIKMADFHRDSVGTEAGQTVAIGQVSPEQKLRLAPKVFYKGKMTMYARRPALELEGYVKLDLPKVRNYNTWLSHTQSGKEKLFYIDFDNAITEEGRKATAGIHYGRDLDLYANFVSEKRSEEDEDFFLPSGKLFYDTASKEFRIEDPRKAAGEKLSGKVFAYRDENQDVKFEGLVNLFPDQSDLKIISSAIGYGNLETDEVKLNALISADFNAGSGVFLLMAQAISDVIKNESVPEASADQTELLYKVANVVGESAATEYEKRSLAAYTSLSLVPGLGAPLVFSSVDLKWSPKHRGFYSVGDLGLSHVGRTDINGAFEGFMEFRKNEDGSPVFNVFLKASPEAWFFFGYEDDRMMIHSSVELINEQVYKKAGGGRPGSGNLVVIPGSEEETLAFVNKFRSVYLDNDQPYSLSGKSQAAGKKEKKKNEEDDGF